jgi:hypothetical protein
VLRTLVTGCGPALGGGGKPHRIISSTRTPSREVRTTGASMSGKMPGSGGMLPVVSLDALNSFPIASWLFVIE